MVCVPIFDRIFQAPFILDYKKKKKKKKKRYVDQYYEYKTRNKY